MPIIIDNTTNMEHLNNYLNKRDYQDFQQQFVPKAKMNDYTNISPLSTTDTTTTTTTSRKQVNIKMARQQQQQQATNNNNNNLFDDNTGHLINPETFAQIQRKLCSFIYIYAIIIISLYVTYACYFFYQHHHNNNNVVNKISLEQTDNQGNNIGLAKSSQLVTDLAATEQQLSFVEAAKLESKIHLLERYIELIAVDLQETKSRLKEREKCDCSISCTFNNTNYSDGSTWQSQCDICACKVSEASAFLPSSSSSSLIEFSFY